MKLFDLYATLGLDARQFNQGISTAKGSFDRFASSIGGGTGKVLKGVSGMISQTMHGLVNLENAVERGVRQTGTAMAGLMGTLTVTGIKYNSMMENYTMDFTTLLQDAEKAQSKVEELRSLDLSTPLDFETLASATKMMLNFGIAEEEAGAKLTQLSDIAMGNKEKFDSLVLAFSQIRSVGKLTMMDLRQMANQGFNPLQVVAEETGVAIGDLQEFMSYGKPSEDMTKAFQQAQNEVKKLGDNASIGAQMLASMAEEGIISADIVAQAIDTATGEGGRFYKATENAAKTLTGQWSMLQGGLKKLIGGGFQPLSQELTENILPNLNEFVDELDTAYNTRGGGNDGLVGMLRVARDELYEIRDYSDEIGENLGSSIRKGMRTGAIGIRNVNAILPDLLQIGREAFNSFRTGFKDNVTQLANTAEQIAPDVLAGAIGLKGDFLVAGLDIVSAIAEGINQDSKDGGPNKIKNSITQLFANLDSWVAEEGNVDSILSAAGNFALFFTQGIVEYAPKMMRSIWEACKRALGTVDDDTTGWTEEQTNLIEQDAAANMTALLAGEYGQFGTDPAYEYELNRLYGLVEKAMSIGDYDAMMLAQTQADALAMLIESEVFTKAQDAIEAAERIANGEVTFDEVINNWESLNSELDKFYKKLLELDGKKISVDITTYYRTNGSKYYGAGDGPQNSIGKDLFLGNHYVAGYATGLDFVPYNNFMARLHEGEAVLTKAEANRWRREEKQVDVLTLPAQQDNRPMVINIDGQALVAAITRQMNKSIGNRNLQQIMAMGG